MLKTGKGSIIMLKKTISSLRMKVYKMKTSVSVMLVYSIIIIAVGFLFYPIIPIVLNYPPGTVNTQFQVEVNNLTYRSQFIIIVLLVLLLGNIYLKVILRNIDKWRLASENNTPLDEKVLKQISRKCLNLPYTIYIMQIFVPNTVLLAILSLPQLKQGFNYSAFRIWVLIFSFTTLAAVVSHIYSKRIFSRVILALNTNISHQGRRISLQAKIFLQLLPVIMIGILFTTTLGYSRLIKDKSDVLFSYYKMQLTEIQKSINEADDINRLQALLKNIDLKGNSDCTFIINSKNEISTSDNSLLSSFFTKYLFELSPQYEGRVYDFYAIDTQGAVEEVDTKNGKHLIGVKFDISSNASLVFFWTCFFGLMGLNILVLTYFSRSLAGDVTRVATSLNEIAQGDDAFLDNKLTATSNDEIGDLITAFNKIQQREKENINSIKDSQAILLEQERLASLGQLIGGIAHNLKTPIMSIAGGIEALKDLTIEYRDSVDDESVTISDHKEIAKEMLSWLDKMKPYCAYMSDVISAVKGQAVQMNASSTVKFTVDELIKRVDLLMKHELKKYHCTLNVDSQIDMSTEIKGEVNNIVQVFDNIIINAMQAYEGKIGTIDLRIVRSGDNVEFTFKDYAKGIPKQISERLFKEMVTTKGKNGTGLGLYMSYATIKGRFGGSMSFSSKEGNGTTFFISIPCIAYKNRGVNK